jgi:hypothetical protein
MTRKGRFDVSPESSFLKTPYEIKRLINKLLFGIEFASWYYSKKSKINIADKAKP